MWPPIQRDELDAFPDALVVSLGELVLTMLIQAGGPRKMINYWGYHRRWRSGLRVPMQAADPTQSTIGRAFHPFIQEPALRGRRAVFYRKRMDDYLRFMRRAMA